MTSSGIDVQLIDDHECTRFTDAIEVLGRRWNSSILLALVRGADRFSGIRAVIPGLSDRMLAQRLRELEGLGLVAREVVPTTPVQVRYRVTGAGAELIRAVQPVVAWERRYGELLDADEALPSAG